MKFKNRFKKLRKENSLTQKELGKKLQLGESTISHYERGDREPSHNILIKIARFFNVSIDYLLGNKKNRGNPPTKEENMEVKELLDRFNVQLEGEELTEQDKEAVIDVLRMLKKRHDSENN